MKNLKIAVVMQSPDIGGAETYLYSLIEQFKKRNHLVVLATNSGKFYDLSKKLNIPFIRIPLILDINGNLRGLIKSSVLLPIVLPFYLKMMVDFRKQKIDVILLTSFTEKLLVTFLSLFFRIPVVWIEYGPLWPVFKRNFYIPKLLYIPIANIPKKIVVPSENTLSSLRKDAQVRKSKLVVIPCGIDLERKSGKKIDEELEKKFVVGSVSRLTREKGQDYLIKSIPIVLKKIPNAYFVIVGSGPDKDYFQNLIKGLGVERSVVMPGFVDDVEYYYSAFDVFVFPTVWSLEGFGLVLPEAMSRKIPVVASNLGPVSEIVDDGINGILVKPRDENELSEAIIKLGLHKDLRDKMGENGQKKAKALYDIEKVSEKILKIFYEASN